MNVKIPLAVLLVLSVALGYMLGTESGRQQRDALLAKVGRKQIGGDADETEAAPADDAE